MKIVVKDIECEVSSTTKLNHRLGQSPKPSIEELAWKALNKTVDRDFLTEEQIIIIIEELFKIRPDLKNEFEKDFKEYEKNVEKQQKTSIKESDSLEEYNYGTLESDFYSYLEENDFFRCSNILVSVEELIGREKIYNILNKVIEKKGFTTCLQILLYYKKILDEGEREWIIKDIKSNISKESRANLKSNDVEQIIDKSEENYLNMLENKSKRENNSEPKEEISKSARKDKGYYIDFNNFHSTIPKTRKLAELSLLADEIYELNREHIEKTEDKEEFEKQGIEEPEIEEHNMEEPGIEEQEIEEQEKKITEKKEDLSVSQLIEEIQCLMERRDELTQQLDEIDIEINKFDEIIDLYDGNSVERKKKEMIQILSSSMTIVTEEELFKLRQCIDQLETEKRNYEIAKPKKRELQVTRQELKQKMKLLDKEVKEQLEKSKKIISKERINTNSDKIEINSERT